MDKVAWAGYHGRVRQTKHLESDERTMTTTQVKLYDSIKVLDASWKGTGVPLDRIEAEHAEVRELERLGYVQLVSGLSRPFELGCVDLVFLRRV